MSKKVIISALVSLDGFIATSQGNSAILEENFFICQPAGIELRKPAQSEWILLGRKTFEIYREKLLKYVQEGCKIAVLTHNPLRLNETERCVYCFNRSVEQVIEMLKKKSSANIWIIGGYQVINEVTSHNLADEIHLITLPLVLNEGIPLFNTELPAPRVELSDVQKYGELTYSTWKRSV